MPIVIVAAYRSCWKRYFIVFILSLENSLRASTIIFNNVKTPPATKRVAFKQSCTLPPNAKTIIGTVAASIAVPIENRFVDESRRRISSCALAISIRISWCSRDRVSHSKRNSLRVGDNTGSSLGGMRARGDRERVLRDRRSNGISCWKYNRCVLDFVCDNDYDNNEQWMHIR